jgi:sugar phosphate isomerase/epimerase
MNEKLLASYWTHAGDAGPLHGDGTSPVGLLERIEAAGRTGWSGLGLTLSDLDQRSPLTSYEEVREHCRRHGITHLEFEFLDEWWDGPENEAAWKERSTFLAASSALGIETIKISSNLSGTKVPFDVYVRTLRELANQAAEIGTRLALEFIPFADFSDARKASELILEVDHPSAGLCVDIWHVYRSGMGYEELVSVVPHEKIFVVELNDAARDVQGTLFEDTATRRRYPGDGDFDAVAFVRAILGTGFTGHWGVEVISEVHRKLPVKEGLRLAHDKTLAVLRAARSPEAQHPG